MLPTLADEVIDAIGAEVPVYARPLEGNFGATVRRGTQDALKGFLELLEGGQDTSAADRTRDGIAGHRRVSFELGRGEVRQGRSLDALLAAYRVGARVTWRRCGAAASALGLSGDDLVRLGELLFAVIDVLSAAAAEGYAREQSERAGELDRRRRRLGTLLVAGGSSEITLDDAAAAAAWRPPQRLSAVVAARVEDLRPALAEASALPASDDRWAIALVEDAEAPGRRRQLTDLLGDAAGPISIGPTVPWREVDRSVGRAGAALRLQLDGAVDTSSPAWTSDLLVPLVLHADPAVGADLVARVLAPLEQLPAATADRLADTLTVWLDLAGARAAVAQRLHVHPQTVRYRLGQLRELFADDLDEPDRRFALMLALRLRRPASRASGGSAD
jgi:hypothetical protein